MSIKRLERINRTLPIGLRMVHSTSGPLKYAVLDTIESKTVAYWSNWRVAKKALLAYLSAEYLWYS